MNKITVGAIVAILLAFGGVVVWSSLNSSNSANYDKYNSAKIIPADEFNGNIGDHVRGNKESEVVLVEYADFQCPGCATMMPKISKLYKEYGDRVAFIFRNYSISGHQNARAASAAVEAAGLQGFFWEMAEMVYDNQSDWNAVYDTERRTDIFAGFFEKSSDGKGDIEKFKSDISNANIQKKIDFDKNLGSKKDNVTGTPSFFINGKTVEFSDNKIEDAINEALKKAGLETGKKESE